MRVSSESRHLDGAGHNLSHEVQTGGPSLLTTTMIIEGYSTVTIDVILHISRNTSHSLASNFGIVLHSKMLFVAIRQQPWSVAGRIAFSKVLK